MKTAVYPGTFDPPTKGHEDIVLRALKIFDKIVIAVGDNFSKNTLFSLEERVTLWKQIFKDEPNIEIVSFKGLLVEAVKKYRSIVIIRGLRVISDFEYELQIASLNHELDNDIDTIFFPARNKHLFLSSTSAKELAKLGADMHSKVSQPVLEALHKKFSTLQ